MRAVGGFLMLAAGLVALLGGCLHDFMPMSVAGLGFIAAGGLLIERRPLD